MKQKENRKGILSKLDTRTKVLGLVTLVLEATFLGSIAIMPAEQVLFALLAIAVVFVIVVIGIIFTEIAEIKSRKIKSRGPSQNIERSPLTPDDPMLKSIIEGAMQTVCRGVTVPTSPEEAKLRAFVFRADKNILTCTHFWAPSNINVKEEVGGVIPLKPENQDKYVVVKSYYTEKPQRSSVPDEPHKEKGVSLSIDDSIAYVLATPILNKDRTIYGVVDFDTYTKKGVELLQSQISDTVMRHLATHLRTLISLSEARDA